MGSDVAVAPIDTAVLLPAIRQLATESLAPAQRRAFARMQFLVAKAADEASAALAEGDQLIAAFSRHMQGRSDRHVERTSQVLDG